MDATTPLDQLPGFRRRFLVIPEAGRVVSAVEDDYHCMRVTLVHDGHVATSVEGTMIRAPWTTCPGAVEQVRKTFTRVALEGFAERGEKRDNCTHLHDLAVLAAAHAFDRAPTVFDILVSDPVDGLRRAELRRNGQTVLAWTLEGLRIVAPAELAGTMLDQMNPWIASLDSAGQEAARLLRWGNFLAHGRAIPMERQSDATRMPSNCYTFQPHRKTVAKRVGVIREFSRGSAQPLDGLQPAAG
ncbi:MAG TPA: hypothetical protein VJM11_15610 [Nevskiaceae bacterium]|nr:hypothetical protein [Nevskiaceae bacterium]